MSDVLAKRWDMDTDTFNFRRFTDVIRDSVSGRWIGVDEGWLPVAWMLIPEIPKTYP